MQHNMPTAEPHTGWVTINLTQHPKPVLRKFISRFLHSSLQPMITEPSYLYLFLLEAVLGVVSSVVLLYIFVRHRALHTQRNVFIVNLLAGNLISSVTLIPLVYLPATLRTWPYSSFACKFFNTFSGTNVYCSTLTVIAIVIDRYNHIGQVESPVTARTRAFASCLVIWLLSLSLASPMLLFQTVHIDVDLRHVLSLARLRLVPPVNLTNEPPINLGYRCQLLIPFEGKIAVDVIQTLFLLPVPMCVMIWYTYKLKCYIAAHSLPFRRSSHQRIRRSRQLTALLTATVVVFGSVWLPFHVVSILFDFGITVNSLHTYDTMFQLLGYTSLFINPVLYGFLNRNFNSYLHKAFRCRQCSGCCCYFEQDGDGEEVIALRNGSAAPTVCEGYGNGMQESGAL